MFWWLLAVGVSEDVVDGEERSAGEMSIFSAVISGISVIGEESVAGRGPGTWGDAAGPCGRTYVNAGVQVTVA